MTKEQLKEEMYKKLSAYFKDGFELTGRATLEYGKVVIPDRAIYKCRDKAIEYVDKLLDTYAEKMLKEKIKVILDQAIGEIEKGKFDPNQEFGLDGKMRFWNKAKEEDIAILTALKEKI